MNKPYNLEDRCILFATTTRDFLKLVPKSVSNIEYSKQLVRSSASVGANYIEACEQLGKKDFLLRAKIAKKEARESNYWLKLIETSNNQANIHQELIKESTELVSILGKIIEKVQ